ncbi:MAG: DUF2306 domain-containing protein [Pseudomonadota bacterium]
MSKFNNVLLYFLTFTVAAYAVYSYGVIPLAAMPPTPMKENFLAHASGIVTHVFASLIALVLGPFQFSARFRQNHLAIHRWFGRCYLGLGVLVGGVSGLYMSQYASGGMLAKLGFGTLAIAWLYTGWCAYLAVRRGAIDEHRKWMVRNFSLTLAAVTLRIYLPASMLAGISFATAYPVIAWACWIPNLIFAEWRINSARS